MLKLNIYNEKKLESLVSLLTKDFEGLQIEVTDELVVNMALIHYYEFFNLGASKKC